MKAYYAFSDEAGLYDNQANNRFLSSHPFYVRANILVDIEEYVAYQKAIHKLNTSIEMPALEEIKWSDLWSKQQEKPRTDFIKKISNESLLEYFNNVFSYAATMKSLKIIFTVTKNSNQNTLSKDKMLQFHLQDALQRVNNELHNKGYATFILDELPNDCSSQIKNICHLLVENGDIINYTSLYSGILFEKSNLSAGIQLADYIAGIFNSFLKAMDSRKDTYQFAKSKFYSFVYPRLRKSQSGKIPGYGIIEVTKDSYLRQQIKTAIEKEVSLYDQL